MDPATTFAVSGSASVLVTSGNATLTGDQLQVSGSGTSDPVTVEFQVTPTTSEPVTITATATPVATESIYWEQSTPVNSTVKPCQVYATFSEDLVKPVVAQTVLQAAPTQSPSPTPSESTSPAPQPTTTPTNPPRLPDTGSDGSGGGVAALLGAAVLVSLLVRRAVVRD